jgi:hypothetical protein
MDVKDALNNAKVAMQQYFTDALALRPGASISEIDESRKNAARAIMEFAKAKKEAHENHLTPYEEKSLGTFDAANEIVMAKVKPEHKECGCHEHRQDH